MSTIKEAKRHLRDRYRDEEGFVGVGISLQNNQDALCVYVADANGPVAQQLRQAGEFEGFPLSVETSGPVEARRAANDGRAT